MSFLTPLFAFGLLAISLPIAFHLWQRRPREQFDFSSLLFLQSSTPRITRRSRLNQLGLLALRAAALGLLALAFSRPFLRSFAQILPDQASRRVAILVDRSASMRRDGLWTQVQSQVADVLSSLDDNDQVALYSFDDQLHADVPFGSQPIKGHEAAELVRKSMTAMQPSWRATHLGRALVSLSEQLRESTETSADSHLILISDLQQGADLAGLQFGVWPADIRVDVRRVAPAAVNNATLRIVPSDPTGPPTSELRVRVTNESTSNSDRFQIGWHSAGARLAPPREIQVPPGRSRLISVPPTAQPAELRLTGDDHTFDNAAFWVAPEPRAATVVFVGAADGEEPGLLYFLERAEFDSSSRDVSIRRYDVEAPPLPLTVAHIPLVVVATPPARDWCDALHAYLEQGGHVVVVLDPGEAAWGFPPRAASPSSDRDTDARLSSPTAAEQLAALCRLQRMTLQEANLATDALLSDIDFRHPIFQPFADPKYSDFSKIRIWRTVIATTDQQSPWTVVARFDDHSPALLEQTLGAGRLWMLTTGWRPQTSQLALSTKFVPLLATMLQSSPTAATDALPRMIGDPIQPRESADVQAVIDPRGATHAWSRQRESFVGTELPGLYSFVSPTGQESVAVNLAPQESLTAALDLTELERQGLILAHYESAQARDQHARQMKDVELETNQKLWRWLLAAALAALAVETYVAARTSRRETLAETS